MRRVKLGLWIAAALCMAPAVASAGDWRATAQRALDLLGGSDVDKRTACMVNIALKDGADDKVVNDYYNIQQTAGGLGDVSFDDFVEGVSIHYRTYLGKDLLSDQGDDEFVETLRKLDPNTISIFKLLNGTVHQIAPGDAHVKLWNMILDKTRDSNTIYSCYADVFVDNR